MSAAFLAGASTVFTTQLSAAGFAIAEQSVSGLGYGFAGAAAVAEDASTIWHNPAGMAFLSESPELSGGVHFIFPSAKFSNTGTGSYNANPSAPGYVPTQGPNDTSDTGAIVPNLFYAHPLSEQISIGLAINAPFGLKTEYADGWVGRYVALETDLKTVNINPAISIRLNDQFTFGFGVSYQQADAVLSNAIDFGLVALSMVPSSALGATALDILGNRGGAKYDGGIRLEGDDAGYGFNAGFIWSPAAGTRIGMHYRSAIELGLSGKADFTLPAALQPYLGGAFADQGGAVDITLPSNLSISLYHELNERLAILADVTWTDWSQFKELFVKYDGPLAGTAVERPIPENWDDTFRYSVGLRYILNESVALRAGFVVDEAAVTSPEYRSPRIPDADRMWLTGGVQWQIGGGFALDISYAHVFVDDSKTNNSTHGSGLVLAGNNKSSVDILSLGGNYRF